jgi:hypothetical protein
VRIKLLFNSGMLGSNVFLAKGTIHDVPEELALDLLKRGRAERVVAFKPKLETAAVASPENAALRTKPPKGR